MDAGQKTLPVPESNQDSLQNRPVTPIPQDLHDSSVPPGGGINDEPADTGKQIVIYHFIVEPSKDIN